VGAQYLHKNLIRLIKTDKNFAKYTTKYLTNALIKPRLITTKAKIPNVETILSTKSEATQKTMMGFGLILTVSGTDK
jgi:hypothetical protein